MARLKKVVWREGMQLDPHHFQQWDHYHQGTLNFRLRTLTHDDWGFSELSIDKEALANGQFGLLSCKGITQDGLMFQMPENNSLPQIRDIGQVFPATAEKLDVYLAICSEKEVGSNCSLTDEATNRHTRFALETIDITDTNSGSDPRQIDVARCNFQILFGSEPNDDFSILKVGVIEQQPGGLFVLSADFIPPSLSIAVSEHLGKITNDILASLVAKGTELRTLMKSDNDEMNAADVYNLANLQTVNSFIPLVNHLYAVTKCHPEKLYSVFLSLAGQLSTFSHETSIRPADLPAYNHKNLSTCYNRLYKNINELLTAGIVVEKAVTIHLIKEGESLHTGELTNEQIPLPLFLIASGDLPERKIRDELPGNIKIASKEDIYQVMAAGMAGVAISHVSYPPKGLPSEPGKQYFRLEKDGQLWDAITDRHNIAIFTTAEFTTLKLELVGLRE